LATSPVRTVDGTVTGNQYTFESYSDFEMSSPEEGINTEDCNSKLVSFTCFTESDPELPCFSEPD
jgi:hypothetical protein